MHRSAPKTQFIQGRVSEPERARLFQQARCQGVTLTALLLGAVHQWPPDVVHRRPANHHCAVLATPQARVPGIGSIVADPVRLRLAVLRA